MDLTLLTDICLSLLPRRLFSFAQFAREMVLCSPVEYNSNILRIFGALSLSTSIPRVFWLLRNPTGAQPGHTPLRIFWRNPRFTFSRKLSEKYLLCPKAMFSIKSPCGVGSNQWVGNLRERIRPRSTIWIILPPSTELRANLSGCQDMIPSAFPHSMNDSISANFIRPGSFAVFASQNEATISNFSLAEYSCSSASCASMLRTWRSSDSLLFLTYITYFIWIQEYGMNKNFLFPTNAN